jgi:putative transcriptional regulator
MPARGGRLAAALLILAAGAAFVPGTSPAQGEQAGGEGVLLVAKPHLQDPNFRETVVLVTGTPDGAAVGVIVNRPTRHSLAGILPGNPLLAGFTDPLYFGGPVESAGLFAVFRADQPPGEALRVAADLWLALNPATVEQLMREPPQKVRFYTGFSGWAPGQLQAELGRGDWWVLDMNPDVAFRADPSGLWEELANRARAVTASR